MESRRLLFVAHLAWHAFSQGQAWVPQGFKFFFLEKIGFGGILVQLLQWPNMFLMDVMFVR